MKKNKKGFTIIELLIAIAILLSILFIAILSLTKASTRKKEEAYKQVEQQIITAAEDYAASNQYILKGQTSDAKRYVLLKDLISGEKLNKVTNPKTGKTIGKCSKVYFDASLKATSFEESSDTNCEIDQPVITGLVKPEIEVTAFEGGTEITDNSWHNGRENLYTKIEIKNKDAYTNGEMLSLEYYDGNSWQNRGVFNGEFITDLNAFKPNGQYKNGKGVSAKYRVVAEKGSDKKQSEEEEVSVNIDTIEPECKVADVNPSGGTYNRSNPLRSVTLSATDNLSGIDGNGSKTFDGSDLKYGSDVKYSHIFKDKAGNEAECKTYVTYENTEDKKLEATPIFRKNSSSGDLYSLGEWTNTSVYVNLKNTGTATIKTKEYKKDNETDWNALNDNGLIISKNGETKIRFRITDDAGNTIEYKDNIIKIDTESPVCEAASVSPNGSSYNYVGIKPTIELRAHDYYGGSGLDTSSPQTIPSSEIKEGKNTYSRTFKDKVGNSKTCSVSVSYKEEEDKVLAADLVLKKNNSSGYDYDEDTWTNTNVYANLKSTGTATIKTKEYKKDNDTSWYHLNDDGLIISENGITKISFRITDDAGNTIEYNNKIIKIDTEPPNCSYTVSNVDASKMVNGWYNNATGYPYLSLSYSDNGSGIESYSGDGSQYAYPGSHTYDATVYDNAGNSKKCTQTLRYDDVEPTFSISLKKRSGSSYTKGSWSSEDIDANIYPIAKTYSGISTKKYSLGGVYKYYLNGDVTVSSTNSVGFEVCSVAGNCASDSAQVNIDKGYPSCSIEANFSPPTIEWYNINSGVPTMSIVAENNGGSPYSYRWITPSLVSSGKNNFSAIVTNEAGRSATCTTAVKYDDTRPTCTSTVEVTNKNTTPVNGWYNINTGEPKITFNVNDTLSGPSSSTIKVDSSAITEGNKTYNVPVSDKAGNTNVCATNVKYDATKPTASITRTTGSKILSYSGSDSTSKIKYYALTNNNTTPTSWQSYSSSRTSVSGTADGGTNKNATYKYIHFKDEAGNTSSASAKIYQTCKEGKNENSTDRRAYFWGSQGGDCTNKTNGYYYRKFRFHSYQCICTIDTVAKKTCDDATAVEETLHPYDSDDVKDYVAEIYYRGNANGQKACKARANEYVDHVCSENTGKLSSSNSSIGWHGYQWYYGARTGRKWNNFKVAGWYHSGGCYDYGLKEKTWAKSNPDDDAVEQCNIACKRSTEEIDYTDSTGTTCELK